MDVEELRVTYYDWMRMTGRLLMTIRSEPSSQGQNIPILRLQMEAVVCLTTMGNGTFWSLMICLDVGVVSKTLNSSSMSPNSFRTCS